MKKSSVLAIGCGGAGNRLLNEFLSLDKRYTGIFMNTNLTEMESLEHFDRDRRCFYIPNADGTGKDRVLAENYIKEEAPKFAEMILKFTNQNHIIFLTSANGGTGSKASMMLPRIIKSKCPEKTISLIATFPNIDESDVDFNNAIDFWQEAMICKKRGFIDNFQFIDNNKPYEEEEINRLAMEQLDACFDIMEGKLDTSDVNRYHTSKGYKVALNLDPNCESAKEAIDKAINESVYFIPENLECDILIGNINTENYGVSNIKKHIECYDFSKFHTKNTGGSMILLNGCIMPTEAVELVQESLKEISNRRKRRSTENEVIIRKKQVEVEPKITKQAEVVASRVSAKDLDDMFNDDSFWD